MILTPNSVISVKQCSH